MSAKCRVQAEVAIQKKSNKNKAWRESPRVEALGPGASPTNMCMQEKKQHHISIEAKNLSQQILYISVIC